MSSNSVCNHTREKQCNDFVITLMITDRIGLHSVLLPLQICIFNEQKQFLLHAPNMHNNWNLSHAPHVCFSCWPSLCCSLSNNCVKWQKFEAMWRTWAHGADIFLRFSCQLKLLAVVVTFGTTCNSWFMTPVVLMFETSCFKGYMQISDCFEAVLKSQVNSTVPFEKIEVCVSVHKLNH